MRRAVEVECAVRSPLWDGQAFYLATDLSQFGLWLSSPLALEPGASLLLSFRPPRWPEWAWPVTAMGEVVRANVPRRRSDRAPAGMGVRFTEIDPGVVAHVAMVLRGLPPPLPQFALSEADVELVQEPAESDALRDLAREFDPETFQLCAEAPLLTAGRPAPAPLPRALRAGSSRRLRIDVRRPPPERPRAARRLIAPHKPLLRLVG